MNAHLAIYLHDLSGGGVERMKLRLIPRFLASGMRVTLVLHRQGGALADAVPAGVDIAVLGGRSTLSDVGGLASYLRAARPNLLLASLDHNNIAALLGARFAGTGTPVLISQHNALSAEAATGWRYRVVPPAYRALHGRAAGVIAVSEGVADDLAACAGIPRGRITVIHNPVLDDGTAARSAAPWDGAGWADDGVPLYVSAGRLVEQKDPATLLAAFALRRRQGPARLLYLGEGPLETMLRARADALGVAEDVRFAGFVANPLPAIRHAAALVLTSRYEGLGNVLIEALGVGTPVIATDCPHGPSEILAGGRFGRLVKVGDAAAVAAAMAEDLRASFPAPALLARGADFTLETATARYLALFEHVLTRGREAA